MHKGILLHIQRTINTNPSQIFLKIEMEEIIPNSFHEDSITQLQKPKISQEKKTSIS
jgi:hypothetical protein